MKKPAYLAIKGKVEDVPNLDKLLPWEKKTEFQPAAPAVNPLN